MYICSITLAISIFTPNDDFNIHTICTHTNNSAIRIYY